jgi:hypothetical protein
MWVSSAPILHGRPRFFAQSHSIVAGSNAEPAATAVKGARRRATGGAVEISARAVESAQPAPDTRVKRARRAPTARESV